MDVKSQLEDAQIEHVTDAARGTAKAGRIVYATDTKQAYLGDGTEWMQIFGSRIGDVKSSMLTEAQFQIEHGTTWILCDGRNVAGSDFAVLTGITSAPDLRGRFPRGKDNGAGVNPDGDVALGTTHSDTLQAHTHTGTLQGVSGIGPIDSGGGGPEYNFTGSTGSTGSNETRPKATIVNFFIKINR